MAPLQRSSEDVSTPAPLAIERALCAEQTRLHGRVIWLSLLATLSVAVIVATYLHAHVSTRLLALWLITLALAAVGRIAIHGTQLEGIRTDPGLPRWRQRYRLALGLQGLAWSMGGLLLFQVQEAWQIDLLVLALMGVAAGAMVSTAFDRVAAALYATPIALMTLAYALGHAVPRSLPLVVVLLPIAGLVMLRVHHMTMDAISLRLAQDDRAEELRRAAELLDRTGAIAGVGGWEYDAQSQRLRLSAHALRLVDMPPNVRLDLEQAFEMIHEADRPAARAALQAALTDGTPILMEAGVRTASGRDLRLRGTGEARWVDGRIVGVNGAVQDVTRVHHIDRALADKHQLLEQLLRTAHQGFWFLDLEGRCTDLNPAMAELLGRSRDEVLGRLAQDHFDGDDRALLESELSARRSGQGGSAELTIRRPDAERRRCLVHGSPLYDAREQLIGSVSVWTDITPRHRMEEALRVSEIVINASAELISVIDEDEVYRSVNDAWCQAMGVSRTQVVGRHREVVLPGMVSPQRLQALKTCLRDHVGAQVRDVIQLPGQAPRTLHTDYYPVLLDGDRPRMVALVSRDVTQDEQQRAALVAVAEYLRGTLEATGDAIFATDADREDEPARFANDQALRLWGLPESLRGSLTTLDVMNAMRQHMVDADAEFRRMEAIVAAGVPAEERLHLRDGRVIALRFSCATVNGRKLRVWSGRDITAEAAAVAARETAAAEQRALLDNFPGYIAVVDGHNRYQHVNERMARLMRRTVDDIVGKAAEDVLGEQRWRKVRLWLDQARRTDQVATTTQYPSLDGQGPVDLEVTHVAGPVQADGSRAVYAFGIDVTERKRAQAALIDALAEAERANKAKSQFLSSMSHELRTPLNAVLGFGQLLAQQPLGAEQKQQVGEIVQGGRHLLGLINDLLDLGRIEAGELEMVFASVHAATLVDECIALMQPLAAERAVTLQHRSGAHGSAHAWADPKRLRQVLLNLLSNGIKYNRPGGEVVVDIDVDGRQIEFRVRDSGPGLGPDEQLRLFKPFERLQAVHTGTDGTGIGLALSRHLVETMGGRIGVHSRLGQGSTFWFQLPLAEAPPAVQAPALPPAAQRRRTALYIEDNPVNLMLMSAMLEDELDLVTEADPVRGLQQAQALQPDVILLDIQLPGIDGYEVLRRLRADEHTRAIPVVAVSANAMRADVAAGMAAGFDAYLTKPVDLDELLSTLRSLLPGDQGVLA